MNILIVDDQPNVISSLLQRVPWQGMGISNVYTANSALAARDVLFSKQVDILLADIEMPQENGLSLVRWIRSKGLEIECILLTSHANFYYAQIAISLEICDYVIQPAATEDIVRSIEKAKDKVFQKRQVNQKIHFQGFLSSTQNSMLCHFFETLPIDPLQDQQVRDQLRELGVENNWDGNLLLVLTRLDHWQRLPPPFPDFFQSFQQALQQVLSFLNKPMLSFYPDDSCIFTVLFAQLSGDKETHLRALQQQVRQNSGCLISLFYSSITLSHLRSSMKALHEAMDKTGKQEMGILKQVTTDLDYAQLSPSRSYERYITLLREYVSSRLDQPLTRDSLAKELGISSDHLSHVVFQAMGCSLKSFLTQERMRHGRELLRTTTLSIGEISAACGYESPAYFSKVYRDTYHHSPRDERKEV